jgi:hypothetical protein
VRPLEACLAAVDDGATTAAEVARRTGLDRDVAEAAMEYLRRLGRVRALPLVSGCPAGGCGGCSGDRACPSA